MMSPTHTQPFLPAAYLDMKSEFPAFTTAQALFQKLGVLDISSSSLQEEGTARRRSLSI